MGLEEMLFVKLDLLERKWELKSLTSSNYRIHSMNLFALWLSNISENPFLAK